MTITVQKQPSARHFREVEAMAKDTCLCASLESLCRYCQARQVLNKVVQLGETEETA